MKPREAIFPFIKLLFSDRKKLLKTLLSYTREADRRVYFEKKYGKGRIPFVNISELTEMDELVENYTYLDGTSRPVDIAFLMSMCRQYKDCNYMEIGSWRGESLSNVAKVAKKCTSLSLSREDMLKFGFGETAADLQRLFSKGKENVLHIEANSMTFDFEGMGEKFDVIFIDGDHTYQGVKSDTENAFKLLRDENSVIIWHDFGGGYEGFDYEVIAGAWDGTPEDKRDRIYRVSNCICGIYTNAKVKPLRLTSPQVPMNVFHMQVKGEPYSAS